MNDKAALLAAIAAHPDEDTPRLAFADWLDESTEERVLCPVCPVCPMCGDGAKMWSGGKRQVPYVICHNCEDGSRRSKWACKTCCHTGTVRSTNAQDRAEFIRVQCELAMIQRSVAKDGPSVGPSAAIINGLADRESALVLEHGYGWCDVAGWKLHGKGKNGATVTAQLGSGSIIFSPVINLTFRRGFVEVVSVPLFEQVLSEDTGGDWEPTTWAGDLMRTHATVQEVWCQDREPYHNGYGESWFDSGRGKPSGAVPGAAEVPTIVHTEMVAAAKRETAAGGSPRVKLVDGRFLSFDAKDAARLALACAVCAVLRSFK